MSETSKPADLVILTILPEETQAVVNALAVHGKFQKEAGTNLNAWRSVELQSYQGPLRVIVGSTGTAGNDKMQAVATDGLNRFQPKVFLVVGVAGGIPKGKDSMFAGDIVLADSVWSIDRGAIGDSGMASRPQSETVGLGLLPAMQNIVLKDKNWSEGLRNDNDAPPNLITGGIAATNFLLKVHEHELVQAIVNVTGNAIRAVEMESWGAAISCQNYTANTGSGVLFGIVRGLSDIVRPKMNGDESGAAASAGDLNSAERNDWKQPAANNAAALVAAWIKHAWPYPSQRTTPQPVQPRGEQASGSQIAPSPDDAARVQQTKSKIFSYLAKDHFVGIPNLTFAPDGLPQSVSAAFPATSEPINRLVIAQACIDAVLAFARELAEAIEGDSVAAPVLVPKRKEQLWKRLVNAMQHAILLCAHAQKLQSAQALIEPRHAAEFGEIEAMSWLSVSVMLRPEIANHLSAEFPKDEPAELRDRNQIQFMNDVEIGIMTNGQHADAKNQSYKVAQRALYPAAAVFPDAPTQQQINKLRGTTLQRAKDGKHLMAVFSKSSSSVTKEFTSFLKNELSVGTVTITSTDGIFELDEGRWDASLVTLLEALQPLLPVR